MQTVKMNLDGLNALQFLNGQDKYNINNPTPSWQEAGFWQGKLVALFSHQH